MSDQSHFMDRSALGIQKISNTFRRTSLSSALAFTVAVFASSPVAAQSAARHVCVHIDDRTSTSAAAVQVRLCHDDSYHCESWQRATVPDGTTQIFWDEGSYSNSYYEVEVQSGGLGCNNGPCSARTQVRAGHLQSYMMSDIAPGGRWARYCPMAEVTYCGTWLSRTGTC